MIPRIDLTFSYWIFAWYLLYICKITIYNPLSFLIIGLILDIIYVLILFYYKNPLNYIFLTIFINLFIKVLPIWTLRNTKIKNKDIIAGSILFFIFACWLYYNDKMNTTTFKNLLINIKKGTPISPVLSALYSK